MTTTSVNPFRKFDDTDPSLVYTGEWFDNPNVAGVFNNTLSSTFHEGDTVHIEFVASQIVVIGATISPAGASSSSGPVSGYTLDGATNSVFLFQADATNATGVTFYNSGQLSLGTHTLDIDVVQITDGIPYLLDVVYLQMPPASVSSTATAVWISTVFVTPSAVATALSGQSVGATSTSSPPIGAIVGGAVGGVAFLVAVALAVYFLYFRRRHGVYAYHGFGDAPPLDYEKEEVVGRYSQPPPPPPSSRYTATPRTVTRGQSYADSLSFAPVTSPLISGGPDSSASAHQYPPSAPASQNASQTSSGSARTLSVVNTVPEGAAVLTPAQRKAAEARRAGEAAASVQYHADSGARFDSQGRPIVAGGSAGDPLPLADVPPEYTPS